MDEQIIWILGSPQTLDLPFDIKWISSEKELPKEGCFAFALVLDSWQKNVDLISSLRQQQAYHLTPIFFIGKVIAPYCEIFDGPLGKASLDIAKEINERIQLLPNIETLEDNELFFLSYLFTRPNTIIHTYLTAHTASGMIFPLLRVLINDRENFDEWDFLQKLVTRDLLAQEKLTDEIQACPHCYSGLLNYKNSCPNCHSIDIKAQQFIHCFACGNIAPTSEFLKQERLICARCNAKLRHIGIDYDKPLEDKLCSQCGFYFLDAEIIITCMNCSKTTDPENLVTRRVYDYTLTKHGEFLARGIEKKIQTHFSNFFEFIELEVFFALVKWQMKLATRYKNLHFSILALKIVNEAEILNEFGVFHTEKLLTEFYERLRHVFRDTDLATHGENFVLFFLPMTDENGCEVLLHRIREFSEQQTLSASEKKLSVNVSFLTSEAILKSQQDAELLIANLHSRIDEHD